MVLDTIVQGVALQHMYGLSLHTLRNIWNLLANIFLHLERYPTARFQEQREQREQRKQ